MRIELDLTPRIEHQLRRQARLAGQDVPSYLLKIVCDQLEQVDGDRAVSIELDDQSWARRLCRWADAFPRLNHLVDDSRDSIY